MTEEEKQTAGNANATAGNANTTDANASALNIETMATISTSEQLDTETKQLMKDTFLGGMIMGKLVYEMIQLANGGEQTPPNREVSVLLYYCSYKIWMMSEI